MTHRVTKLKLLKFESASSNSQEKVLIFFPKVQSGTPREHPLLEGDIGVKLGSKEAQGLVLSHT